MRWFNLPDKIGLQDYGTLEERRAVPGKTETSIRCALLKSGFAEQLARCIGSTHLFNLP